MEITKEKFGTMPNGREVNLYTLKNDNNVTVKITNYAGIITHIECPDREGIPENIVLGFDDLKSYLSPEYLGSYPYLGALIGRYGNRIGNASFSIDGVDYKLAANNGPNNLHGGPMGYDRVLWDAETIEGDAFVGLKLTHLDPDMNQGFPGNVQLEVIYTLDANNELKVAYMAKTDKTTHVNLTQHTYFNLNALKCDVLDHEVMIKASATTEINENLTPTGKLLPVKGTPFDFTSPKKLGAEINTDDEQLKFGGGYDHNFVVDCEIPNILNFIAKVTEPTSGRIMEVYSTEPGVQLYTGNFLDVKIPGQHGKMYTKHMGFCLETQHFPDTPNQPDFPSTLLQPGEEYFTETVFKFGVG